jgi:hypothetical protein
MRLVIRRLAALAPFALGAAACAVAVGGPDAAPAAPEPAASASAPSASAPPDGAAPAPSAGAAQADRWRPCGAPTPAADAAPLDCQRLASPGAALSAILEVEKPMVLGLGEAHAQKGTEAIASTAWRTTEQLLPVLDGRAEDLVLELWVGAGACGAEQAAKVAEQQRPVTQDQAASNQNEYVALAQRAKDLGIQPHVLRPSCDEVERIAKAGDDAVVEMLTLITEHMERKVMALRGRPGGDRLVVTYGGAMHNDLAPQEGREAWSFGPALAKATADRYVEIDLVVPEYVKDTPAWTAQRWYPAWPAARDAPDGAVTAIRVAPRSYAVVLPRGVTRQPQD